MHVRCVGGRQGRVLLLRSAVVVLGLVACAPFARAQSTVAAQGDPARCVAVVEELGDVGFRISDAQVIADATLTELRKRVGQEGAVYAGVPASLEHMGKLLGPEVNAQAGQIEYFKKAIANAKYKVRARFGGKGKKHWITLSCRAAKSGLDDLLDNKRFEGKTFQDARDKLAVGLPTFCPAISSTHGAAPTGGATPAVTTSPPAEPGKAGVPPPDPPWLKKRKPSPAWVPPPPRE